jgi:hypothetical protein
MFDFCFIRACIPFLSSVLWLFSVAVFVVYVYSERSLTMNGVAIADTIESEPPTRTVVRPLQRSPVIAYFCPYLTYTVLEGLKKKKKTSCQELSPSPTPLSLPFHRSPEPPTRTVVRPLQRSPVIAYFCPYLTYTVLEGLKKKKKLHVKN